MDRKELYAKVKELNLQEEIKKNYNGKNFTQLSSVELEKIIKQANTKKNNKNKNTTKNITTTKVTETTNPYELACIAFIGILKDSGKLNEILNNLK